MHDEANAAKVRGIYYHYLKDRGWRAQRPPRTWNKQLITWIFTYKTDKITGEKGIHYAEDDYGLGMMIKKYGLDHAPVDPKILYVGLLEKDRKTVTQIYDEVVAASADTRKEVGNASLISDDNKAKKPNTNGRKNSPSLTTAAVTAANGRENHTRNNSGVLKNGLDDDPSSNKKVAHPKDNDSRSGVVMDKRKVDNDGLQKSSNDVTKKPKKNSPVVTVPITPAVAACSRVSMSPSLLDAVPLPGGVGGDIVNLSTNMAGDHSCKSPDAAAAIDKSTVPEADPNAVAAASTAPAFNMSSVQDSIERLEQLKVQSLELRDFAKAGEIMKTLGIVHSKLAEVKCCEKGIKAAAEAEDFTKAGQLKSERDIMRVHVMQALRSADTNETIVNSSVKDREVRVSIILEKGSKSSNIMSGFDKVSRETSNGLERLDELKKKSALNFGTIGKVNTSLGVIYAKLAEFKAAGEQVELALREAGDVLFGKEQMSTCTTKVKSEF